MTLYIIALGHAPDYPVICSRCPPADDCHSHDLACHKPVINYINFRYR